MSSFLSSKSFEDFDGFISNLIQYLSSNKINNRLNVSVEHIFYSNDNIKISANYLDENLNFDFRAKLWCTVLNKETQLAKKFPFFFSSSICILFEEKNAISIPEKKAESKIEMSMISTCSSN